MFSNSHSGKTPENSPNPHLRGLMGIALQLLFNSLVTGLVLAVMAVGFHLAFRTVKVGRAFSHHLCSTS